MMNTDALQTFLKRSGRSLEIRHNGTSWVVSVDRLPGTEVVGDDLAECVQRCLLGFVVRDWMPRK